jgi:hypothetical protein
MKIPATLNAMWRLGSGSPLQVEAFAGGDNAAASRSSGESPTDHRFSRKPLKKGCRTLPSADMARYSISANNFGSTQMSLWPTRFAQGCVFRISGFSRVCRSAAEALSTPWSTLPA